MTDPCFRLRPLLAAALLLAVLTPVPARAASIVVTTTDDELNADGDCSLREAMTAANGNAAVDACPAGTSGPDDVTFAVTGSIVLASQLPTVLDALAILGPGASQLTLSGNGAVRVLAVGSGVTLDLEDVRIADARAPTLGGGVNNNGGTLIVKRCVFDANLAPADSGGAINSALGATTTIEDSTFTNNSSGIAGGAIRNDLSAMTLRRSTFSANASGCYYSCPSCPVTCNGGGALYNTGSAFIDDSTFTQNTSAAILCILAGTVDITSSTFVDNAGGALVEDASRITVANSILKVAGGDSCSRPVIDAGANLQFPTASCGAAIPVADPLVDGLQLNAPGTTPTHALLTGSPAIDTGACVSATDQRGVARPQGSACDVGAYERITAVCGNGLVETGEDCDDGNLSNDDCCSAVCAPAPSGDACADDGNGCTDDQCDGAGACMHPDNAVACDDGSFCNGLDTCSGGSCSAHAGDPCAGGAECGDVCDELAGSCNVAAGTACTDDGNVCTADACDGAGGCQHPAGHAGTACRSANGPCDVAESCDGTSSVCPADAVRPSGFGCNDGDACTTADACDGAGGCVGGAPPDCDDANVCTADSCAAGSGCLHDGPARDGYACIDDDPCTEGDVCTGGTCGGDPSGADSDADGYCDAAEIQRGCDPNDTAEIPPQAPTFGGSPIGGAGNVLVTYVVPASHKVAKATDPSCAALGLCGPGGFCVAGAVADPCTANGDCDQAANTCRIVASWALAPDLAFYKAGPTLNRAPFAGFAPLAPGCSRKVDVMLDPSVKTNLLKLKVTGSVLGKPRRDYDLFKYR